MTKRKNKAGQASSRKGDISHTFVQETCHTSKVIFEQTHTCLGCNRVGSSKRNIGCVRGRGVRGRGVRGGVRVAMRRAAASHFAKKALEHEIKADSCGYSAEGDMMLFVTSLVRFDCRDTQSRNKYASINIHLLQMSMGVLSAALLLSH